ncbi:class I SAM-dependent methyltransferase [Verrucomicrobiales bacterium]|nr:class I SAM-dependent methyltransferase [Verrucomicrobiales bacterium]
MRRIVKLLLSRLGYKIIPEERFLGSYSPSCPLLEPREITDLEALYNISLSIPGMISPKSGQMLYTLCVFQKTPGDVVEIGSWQGRSTSFLARAVSDSSNGKFFAIDHFKGNVGKESEYVVGASDLSDLKENFQSNIARIGLAETVEVMDMDNVRAARELEECSVRFLFIDGDHSYEGVKKDLQLFVPKLCPGAIIVFDDYSKNFPGLLVAVDEFLTETKASRLMTYENTLVVLL